MTQPWLNEAITVTLDEDGTPTHFVWCGQRHSVVKIIRRWELDTDWWRPDGAVYRLYLAVLTDRHLLCVICHDQSILRIPLWERDSEENLHEQWRLLRLYD